MPASVLADIAAQVESGVPGDSPGAQAARKEAEQAAKRLAQEQAARAAKLREVLQEKRRLKAEMEAAEDPEIAAARAAEQFTVDSKAVRAFGSEPPSSSSTVRSSCGLNMLGSRCVYGHEEGKLCPHRREAARNPKRAPHVRVHQERILSARISLRPF